MLFNSYIFIFIFFPLCILGFYLLQRRNSIAAKLWLIGFSLWFYGYFNTKYLLIMLCSILINYAFYLLLCKKKNHLKWILGIGVLTNLVVLFYFKYFDFFINNVNAVFKTSLPLQNILLPLGISFFTFQQISFLVDSYRGEIPSCSFIDYSLFVSFFPQLIAGPIVTHDEMLPQFQLIGKNKWNSEIFANGLFVFTLGLAKKVLIADTFGKAVDWGYYSIEVLNATDAILVILFYTLQLYFDFSGYCDMAIGIGKMLGITIPINFNSPYKAANIIDFWKRWHITLNRFFTKNIYIPLGGNRKGTARMYFNLLLIFFLSGFWHGAGWNYILWGLMHGILYVITRFIMLNGKKSRAKAPKTNTTTKKHSVALGMKHILGVTATFVFVNIAWVYFRASTVSQANIMIAKIFRGNFQIPNIELANAFNLDEFWYVLKIAHLTDFLCSKYILMICFVLIILVSVFCGKNVHELAKKFKPTIISAFVTAFLLIWCIVSLSGVSTFLYFNF